MSASPRYSEITEIAGAHSHKNTNVRHIVQEELRLLNKNKIVNKSNNKKDARAMIDQPDFKRGLDNYFEEIDNKNRVCRCITFWSMVTFGLVATFVSLKKFHPIQKCGYRLGTIHLWIIFLNLLLYFEP